MCSIERRLAVSESECCYAESVGAVAVAAIRTAGMAADMRQSNIKAAIEGLQPGPGRVCWQLNKSSSCSSLQDSMDSAGAAARPKHYSARYCVHWLAT